MPEEIAVASLANWFISMIHWWLENTIKWTYTAEKLQQKRCPISPGPVFLLVDTTYPIIMK
jgi:hypothetical protein